jgi:hypothetical protein
MTKASDSAEPFGPEPFGPELKAEGLKAEGLVAGRQSLRKDFITILFYNWFYPLLIRTHFPDEPKIFCKIIDKHTTL